MRKIFTKGLAAATSVAMAATLMVGVGVSTEVKADDTAVALQPWNVYQCGTMISDVNGETWNIGKFGSFVTSTGESIAASDLLEKGERSVYTKTPATGFTAVIEKNGIDKDWENDRINPWQVRVEMKGIEVVPGHEYTLSFKAKASTKKYTYLGAGVTYKDGNTGSIFEGNEVKPFKVIGTQEDTYSIDFTNWVGVDKFDFTMMLGAFNSTNDFDGTSLVDQGLTATETGWTGTITVSDFTITDKGLNPNYEVKEPEPENPNKPNNGGNNNSGNTTNNNNNNNNNQTTTPAATTAAPAVTTAAPATVSTPAQVKSVKAKNSAKKAAKITWKKVKGAKSYQVKVGNKKYNAKKVSYTVKKLTVGKTYKVQVRAKNAAGFGKWSKAVKVTIKK